MSHGGDTRPGNGPRPADSAQRRAGRPQATSGPARFVFFRTRSVSLLTGFFMDFLVLFQGVATKTNAYATNRKAVERAQTHSQQERMAVGRVARFL